MDISDLIYKTTELQSEGLCCSQIVVKLLTEDYSLYENEMLIEAMSALGYGLHSKKICGALTGCACALAVCNEEKPYTKLLIKELVYWFEKEFGSCECSKILNGKKQDIELCTNIVAHSINQCYELLAKLEANIVCK